MENSFSELPAYIHYDIFKNLSKPELRICREVCKGWQEVIDACFEVIPEELHFRFSLNSTKTDETRFSTMSIKELPDYALSTEDALLKRDSMENFERKLSLREFIDNERMLIHEVSSELADKTQNFIEQEKFANMMLKVSDNVMDSSMIIHSDVPQSPFLLEKVQALEEVQCADIEEVEEIEEDEETTRSRSCRATEGWVEDVNSYDEVLVAEPIIVKEPAEEIFIEKPVDPVESTFVVIDEIEVGVEVMPEEVSVQTVKQMFEKPQKMIVKHQEPTRLQLDHLELDHCILTKKSSTFHEVLKSPIAFKKVSIGYAKLVNSDSDLEDFWIHLGKSVTHLDLQRATHDKNFINIFDILPHFHNLEVLEINYKNSVNPLKASRFMSVDMPLVPTLILHKLCADHLETFDLFIKSLPGAKLYIRSCHDMSYNEENFMKLVKRHAGQIKDLGKDLIALMLNSYKGFLITQMRVMSLESLECDVKEIESYSYIPSILNVKKDIKVIKLWNCYDFPSFKNLTFLHIKFLQDIKSFKPLESLQNLEGLEFEFVSSRWRCFFGHELLSCPKLRHLGINTSKTCIKCWNYLLDSFELDSMNLTTNLADFEPLPLIGQKQNLTKFTMCSTELVELPSFEMENLKSLTLLNFIYGKITVGAGNLKSLYLDGVFKSRALIEILKESRKLEDLKIVNLAEEESVTKSLILDQIQQNCINLKILDINIPSPSDEYIREFFSGFFNLKVIHFEDGTKSSINYMF